LELVFASEAIRRRRRPADHVVDTLGRTHAISQSSNNKGLFVPTNLAATTKSARNRVIGKSEFQVEEGSSKWDWSDWR
jgi:hypothetical protein